MNWIKNLKVSQKLVVLICIAVFFLLVVASIGYYFNQKSCNDMVNMYSNKLLPLKYINITRVHINANNSNLYDLITEADAQKMPMIIEDINKRAEESNQLLEDYSKTNMDPYEVENLQKLKQQIQDYRYTRAEVIRLAQENKDGQALKLFKAQKGKFDEIVATLKVLADYNIKAADEINKQNDKDAAMAKTLLIVISLSSLALLVLFGLMISNMITRPITVAVESLNEGSQQVSSAAMQVSTASQQLAEGSAEQASSIEETSSTLEESASMVRQNTENTKQAALLAKQAKDSADKGNKEMQEMMTSMSELKKSSDEIAKIIKVIDEIAFQTNILALNAAVEAARAGEAGMGFAVVAEEVRNLAQRSAQAAKDTAVIIESNIHLSEQGVEVSKHVNESLLEINTQSQKVSELLDEVAAASQEQAQGIAQINKAISQMEQVVQSNASTAEESASAAEELSSQAVNVKEIVNSLVLLVKGADELHEQAKTALVDHHAIHNQKAIPTTNRRKPLASASSKTTSSKNRLVNPEDVIPLDDDTAGF